MATLNQDASQQSSDDNQTEDQSRQNAQTAGVTGSVAVQGELTGGDVASGGGGEAEAVSEGDAGPSVGSVADPNGTPMLRTPSGPSSPIKKSKLPSIPSVTLPDLTGMRSPVVPPPPKSVEEKRFDILKSTGMLPTDHHATVQRAVDTTVAKARAAQSKVIFQTGTIAARASSRITNLSHKVPGVVGGGVAKIRSAAAAAQTAIDEVTDRQIRAVITKANEAAKGLRTEHADVAQDMHNQLMAVASPELLKAKEDLNTELTGLLTEAGTKIAQIKTGSKPADFTLINPPPDPPAPEPSSEVSGDAPPDPPSPPTWDQAEADLSAKLGASNETNLTEFANIRVAASLPGMVNPIQENYDEGNDLTALELDSDKVRLQMFNQTFDLIAPTQLRIKGHTEREDDSTYIGNLAERLSLEYNQLDGEAQSIVRQLDEKRVVLKQQTLNPDYSESQPHKAIEGLQKAGKKIEDGIVHQAKTIEASLKGNLAALALEYPGIVDRLNPIIQTGGFLEAADTLRQMKEAQESIGIMVDGHLEQIAIQAEAAYVQAQKGLEEQLKGLRKTAQDSAEIIGETQARITYSIIQTGAEYTGVIDEGFAAAIPQIMAHADRTAAHLLKPDKAKEGQLSNLKDAAMRFMNGVIAGEWSRYTAQLMGLEDQLGGVQHTVLTKVDNDDKPMGMVREGVVVDAKDRAHRVHEALEPRPMTNEERLVAYGLAPFTFGASVAVVGYEYASDPNENDIVIALSVPPPGPMAIEEAQTGPKPFHTGPSLIQLIKDRMTTEGEQQDILSLFSANADVSRQAKNNLFADSDNWGGISSEAALGLMQSLGPAEISSSIMTPEENARMAQALEDTLDDPTDREIAASYMNGEPDQALALRIRRLIDQQRKKEYNNQLQTGQLLDQLVQRELAYGSDAANIPPGQLDRMRNAAFLRFPEVVEEGRTAVTLTASPTASASGPLTQGQITRDVEAQSMSIDTSALSSSADSGQSMMSQPPAEDANMSMAPETPAGLNAPDSLAPRNIMAGLNVQERTSQGVALSAEETEALNEDPNADSTHSADTADEAVSQAQDLRSAQDAVVAYMNRPLHTRTERAGNNWRNGDLQRMHFHDQRHPQVNYDTTTGKVRISPAAALQSYNQSLIRHGSGHPITRGRAASATIARVPGNREPSENQINLMNDNFSDNAFNAIRVEWDNASPRERANPAFKRRWDDAQEDHRLFLRSAAQGMIQADDGAGLREDQLDDSAAVEAFLTDELGDRFGEVGDSFRQAGGQIISKGRIDIDTGMRLAAEGWGTNEALMQNVMTNRSDFEWNETRGDGETMQSFAYREADDELSGDDWQAAREKLRGEDTDDLQRAATLDFLIDQQLEDGTGWLSSLTMEDSPERAGLLRDRAMVDERLEQAAVAGMAEARRRGADIPEHQSVQPIRGPFGTLNPMIARYAMDGDGNLRGDGHSLSAMGDHVRQSARYYREEIDSQESVLMGIITAVAVIASVLAMLIPGVNGVVAGIWIALLSGAATVAAKSGMRGNRYGWEEAAVDVGTAAVEAATAGVAGTLSKGAQLGGVARAATLADDAVRAAEAATKISKLGKFAGVGAKMGQRMGGKAAGLTVEISSSVTSGTANAAMNDEMWNDGMGTGLLRLAGHGAQAGITTAVSSGLSDVVTGGLDKRLAPLVGDPETVGRLSRMGRGLSPNARELITETASGLAGSISSEGINILADFMRHPDQMTRNKILERLGKTGLQELFTTVGKTAIKQQHRARYSDMMDGFEKSGKTPDEADLVLMTKLAESGGVLDPGETHEDVGARLSRAQADAQVMHNSRIADMPSNLQPFLRMMPRDKALDVMGKIHSGDLGSDADRAAFSKSLSKDRDDFDPSGFDAVLLKSRDEFAATQEAEQAKIDTARDAVLGNLSPRAQENLKGVNLDGLAALTPEQQASLAKGFADGNPPDDVLKDALKDRPTLRETLSKQLEQATKAIVQASAEDARVKARIDDDLAVAIPKDLTANFEKLNDAERAGLHAALSDKNGEVAQTLLRKTGLTAEAAKRVSGLMGNHIEAQQVRRNYMDNVPEEHRDAMGQLTPDMLMEVRVAQFTKKPLNAERMGQLLAEVQSRRPGADVEALKSAIEATMVTAHGRPGFRQGLAQKRALLDLVPLGMKVKVLKTPMITLDDAAFLAFVKGSGSENAVTLIVNGEPVVLMRASADPSKLGEEGLHVLQYNDPNFRDKMSGLDENRIARWEELDFDDRIDAYGTKIDVEIDAQKRTIARLEKRKQNALLPSTKSQTSRQLEIAHENLAALSGRKKSMRDITPEMREEIRLGLRKEPKWLDQPARMFNKKSDTEKAAELEAELNDILRDDLPAARLPVATELRAALKRTPGLDRNDKRRLVGLLRTMKGVLYIHEMVEVLQNLNVKNPAKNFEHLSNLKPGQLVDAMQLHLFDTRFEKESGWKFDERQLDMQNVLSKKKIGSAQVMSDERAHKLFTALASNDGGSHELTMAKQAMFLSLEFELDNPKGRSHSRLRERLELAEAILNIGPEKGRLTGLASKRTLQAFALEAMATTKTLMLDENAPKATHAGLIAAISKMTKHGVDDFEIEDQRALFQTLARAYYSGGSNDALAVLGDLPKTIRESLQTDDTAGNFLEAGKMLKATLDMLSRHSMSQNALALKKVGPFLAYAVNYANGDESMDRVSLGSLHEYVSKALNDPNFAKSLVRVAGRYGGIDPDGIALAVNARDHKAITQGELVKLDQEDFVDRHSTSLDKVIGRGIDIEKSRETVAQDTKNKAGESDVAITDAEARAIAQRIEVLDQTALFSGLTADPKARGALMANFIAQLKDTKTFDPPAPTDAKTLNLRGEKLEVEFRRFVREVAASDGVMSALFNGAGFLDGDSGTSVSLSKEARTELILIMVRGRRPDDFRHLDSTVQRELTAAHAAMVTRYVDLSQDDIASETLPAVKTDLLKMLSQGIIHIETSAKGTMLEGMFEGMLRQKSTAGLDQPTLFDDVTSRSNSRVGPKGAQRKSTEFNGFDAAVSGKFKSADHIVQITKKTDNTPPGLEQGQSVAVDSKNGPGAFDKDQFKRYFVDMIKGARGNTDSLFTPDGDASQANGTALSALIYLADSPENAKGTRTKAIAALQSILQTSNTSSSGMVEIKIGEAKFEISLVELQQKASQFTFHFGRLSSDGIRRQGVHQLGPISMQDNGDTVSRVVDDFIKKGDQSRNSGQNN